MNVRSSRSHTTLQPIFATIRRGLRWIGIDVRELELKVHIAHDEEAGVWYVASSDVPGLRLEAEDPFALVQRIMECLAELVELNADEILTNHAHKERPSVSLRPVFDSPLQLAHA
jgi:hypothetical protein